MESLFPLESSRPELDHSLALAGALDPSDSHTDPKKAIPQTIVFYTFNLKSYFLKFVESIQLRICIWDIVESLPALKSQCCVQASPKLQYLLEDVLQSTVKSARLLFEHLRGYLTQLQGPIVNLKPTQDHPTPVLWWFLPSEVELVFEEERYLDCTKLLLGALVFIEEELHSL